MNNSSSLSTISAAARLKAISIFCGKLRVGRNLRDVRIFSGASFNLQNGTDATNHSNIALDVYELIVELFPQLALLKVIGEDEDDTTKDKKKVNCEVL